MNLICCALGLRGVSEARLFRQMLRTPGADYAVDPTKNDFEFESVPTDGTVLPIRRNGDVGWSPSFVQPQPSKSAEHHGRLYLGPAHWKRLHTK